MRHRVDIQESTDTLDEYGSTTQAWATVRTVWSDIRPLAGRELWQAQQALATVTHEIKMRHNPSLTPQQRLVYKDRVFNIGQIINEDEKGRVGIAICTEEVAV